MREVDGNPVIQGSLGKAREGLKAELGATRRAMRSGLVSRREAIARIREQNPTAKLDKLPKQVENFGRFMRDVQGKPLTPRRLIKAYLITRSSVGRSALPRGTVCKLDPNWGPLPRQADLEKLRPEDVMASALLATPEGQDYLDAAEKGRFDKDAAQKIVHRVQCYGFAKTTMSDMRYAAERFGDRTTLRIARKMLKGPAKRFAAWVVKDIKGIKWSKAGFFAAMLGRGDLPVLDARERKIWSADPSNPVKPSWPVVDKLRRGFRTFPVEVPPDLEPLKVYLVHHMLWDAYGGSKTTHYAPVRSMQFAGSPGLAAISAAW